MDQSIAITISSHLLGQPTVSSIVGYRFPAMNIDRFHSPCLLRDVLFILTYLILVSHYNQ